MPTLTAAALVTDRIGLGTFVASPNFRHPVVLHRDVQSLDDISGGRFLLGVGTGGDLDSGILGGATLGTRELWTDSKSSSSCWSGCGPRTTSTPRGVFGEMAGRAESLGFTDVITHWPRPNGPYAGLVTVPEDVAAAVATTAG